MNEETQPKVPLDFTVAPISDSSFDSVDSKPGSDLLPLVVDIANQVSAKIRQKYSEVFSLFPILVL